MEELSSLITFFWIAILSLIGFIGYAYNKHRKNVKNRNANPIKGGSVVWDLQHGFRSKVEKVKDQGDRIDIHFNNGKVIPYIKGTLNLMNVAETLIGETPIFTHGVSQEMLKSGEYLGQVEKIRNELFYQKSREIQNKEKQEDFIKEIVKKSQSPKKEDH